MVGLLLPAACARCAAALRDREVLCGVCRAALGPTPDASDVRSAQPALDAGVAAVWFEREAADWIRRFKYPRRGLMSFDAAARAVVIDLARRAAAAAPMPAPDRVIPIPLHARSLRRRGFNPAAILARSVARAIGRPCDATALVRTRDTASQTGLSRRERRRNVRGAFAPRGPQPGCVWLVDDVVTTSATLAEAARVLRAAGVRRVVGICAARTPPPAHKRGG